MSSPTSPGDPGAWRLRGQVDGRELGFEARKGTIRVGSSPRSDLRLPNAGVSREHAVLEVTDGGIVVLDCGSKNGTFIDGRRIDRASLAEGSVVGFGPVELVLEAPDSEDTELAISFDTAFDTMGAESHYSLDSLSRETAHLDASTAAGFRLAFPADHVPGTSPAMAVLYRQMETAARGEQPVLIVGETGVGKEGLVSILHQSSRRSEGPLLTLNCAAIPAELFEAELFGVGRGVATGVDPRPGKVKLAEGGTLFLDEIGDMPPALQTKLLRVLQENEIQPLGGRAEKVNIRVVAATNAELESKMGSGAFRRDLYYRLAGSVLEVPPLRKRRADIPGLVEYFLRQFSSEARIRVRGVTVKAMGLWLAHDWPGNVRELRHEVQRAVSRTADLGIIDARKVSIGSSIGLARATVSATGPSAESSDRSSAGDFDDSESLHLETRLRALETELVSEALRRTRGRQNRAAKLLRISRNGLARRLERLGIDYRDFR